MLSKSKMQKELDATVASGKYTEGLGEIILEFADITTYKRGLYYRYTDFEIDYVIKPRMVDMMLLKAFKYEEDKASAYTYLSLITSSAILDAVKDISKAKSENAVNLFYVEDLKYEVHMIQEDYRQVDYNDVWLDRNILRLI